ncbi:hypothetical protein GCM10027431_30670 [Lysobacter rhizosphaerae]
MDPISLEDLALLEVLQRLDQRAPLSAADTEMQKRLVESGLVEEGGDEPHLTAAGIELCKSLQHRVAADAEAAKIREQREAEDAPEN